MTFLLIIPVWIVLMALVVILCAAARVGDKELRSETALAAEQPSWGGDRGSQAAVAVVARPGARTSVSRKAGSARERTGVGVAA